MGMGIFYTIYYAGMGISPAIAGYARELTGNPAVPIYLAGVAILLAIVTLVGFWILHNRKEALPT